MTARQFAGLLGVLLAIAGVLALSLPVTADYDAGMFGNQSADCGSALSANDSLGGDPLAECAIAISTRRAWSWPLGIVGLVVLAGTLLIQPARAGQPRGMASDTP